MVSIDITYIIFIIHFCGYIQSDNREFIFSILGHGLFIKIMIFCKFSFNQSFFKIRVSMQRHSLSIGQTMAICIRMPVSIYWANVKLLLNMNKYFMWTQTQTQNSFWSLIMSVASCKLT